jgi:putative endonuclease
MQPCVYIMASRRRGTLYVGVTSDLPWGAWEHREGALARFTKRRRQDAGVVRVAQHDGGGHLREKQIKEWRRLWKIELIEAANPTWRDLSNEIAI